MGVEFARPRSVFRIGDDRCLTSRTASARRREVNATRSSSARRVALSMVQAEGDDDSMDAELKHRAALRGSRLGVKGDHVTPHKASSHLWGQGVGEWPWVDAWRPLLGLNSLGDCRDRRGGVSSGARTSNLSGQIISLSGGPPSGGGRSRLRSFYCSWTWERAFIKGAFAEGAEVSALSIARGNGKSCLLAGVAASGVSPGGPLQGNRREIVCVASSFMQARIIFEDVLAMEKKRSAEVWEMLRRSKNESQGRKRKLNAIKRDLVDGKPVEDILARHFRVAVQAHLGVQNGTV